MIDLNKKYITVNGKSVTDLDIVDYSFNNKPYALSGLIVSNGKYQVMYWTLDGKTSAKGIDNRHDLIESST